MANVLLANGLLPGTVYVDSEFLLEGVHGGCGPNTADMAESYGEQRYIGMRPVYNRMRAANRCDANGVTQMGKIAAQAQADGFRIARLSGGWKSFAIDRLREGAPVAYEPSRGQALKDLLTGSGMNAQDLAYHFNLMVGYWPGGKNAKANKDLPEGFWFADGDNGAVDSNPGANAPTANGRKRMANGRLVVFYSAANVLASGPYDMTAIYPKVTIAPPNTLPVMPAAYAALLADPDIRALGWKYGSYNGEPALISPEGIPVYRGFADWLCGHGWAIKGDFADNLPLGPEELRAQVEAWNIVHGKGTVQTFHKMRLCWSQSENRSYAMWLGDAVVALEKVSGKAA